MLYKPGKIQFPVSKTHDLNLQMLLLIDIWRSKTQEGLQGQDSSSLALKPPDFKDGQACSVNKEEQAPPEKAPSQL